MTVRLLTIHSIYPANAIVTLDAGTEAGLIAAKLASATLTGGVVWTAPVNTAIGAIRSVGSMVWSVRPLSGVSVGSTAYFTDGIGGGGTGSPAVWDGSAWVASGVSGAWTDPVVTYANLPTAGGNTGKVYRVSDVGVGAGSYWISDGTRWRPFNGRLLLAQSAVAAFTTSAAEVALATITVPGGALGLTGGVRVKGIFSMPNSATTKQMSVRYGGLSGMQFWINSLTTNNVKFVFEAMFLNRNSVSSQVQLNCDYSGGLGGTTASLVTGAINSAVDQTLVISGLVTGGETLTLEAYSIELFG